METEPTISAGAEAPAPIMVSIPYAHMFGPSLLLPVMNSRFGLLGKYNHIN